MVNNKQQILSNTLIKEEIDANHPKIANPYHPNDLESAHGLNHEGIIDQVIEILDKKENSRIIVISGNPGSGKTSTLKHMEKSEKINKIKIIPIFIDTQKYNQNDLNELFLQFYKETGDLVGKATGKSINRPIYSKKSEDSDIYGELKSFFLILDSIIEQDSTLLFILDDFDNFISKFPQQSLENLFKYLRKMERNWSNYALILSVSKSFENTVVKEPLSGILNDAFYIDVENVLDDHRIRDAIIEPVQSWLNFNDEAVNRIIFLSGKNFYFQQLICFHLVKYLNKRQLKQCSKKVIDEAVHEFLSADRKEFDHAWNNILTIDSRLIVSGLADPAIMETLDKYVYIGKNSLLHDVFKDSLPDKIKKLQELGFLTALDDLRFLHSPFSIPMYGMWVRQKHPFIKTVFQHIDSIAESVDLSKVLDLIQKTPADKLDPYNADAITELIEKWLSLQQSIQLNGGGSRKIKSMQDFLKTFCQYLELTLNGKHQSSENSFIIDISSVNIASLKDAYCFIQDKADLKAEDISIIEDAASNLTEENSTDRLTIFFYFRKSDIVENLVKKPYLNLITIDENTMKRIILSEKEKFRDTFKKVILSKLSLTKISPYKPAGPAKVTFYGRIDSLNQLSNTKSTSYAVIGSRKIGKTSLLLKLTENPPRNIHYIYISAELEFAKGKNYRSFLKNILSLLSFTISKKVNFGILDYGREIDKFSKIIQQLSREGKRIVIVVDEADFMVEFDQKHEFKLIRMFRFLSQKDFCQFIFAGFRTLYRCKRDIDNPFHNFGVEIPLKPLERDPAIDLITKPLENMGIKYGNPEDRESILDYTSCHPMLLQFFCQQLIAKIEKHPNVDGRRTIFKEDIEAVMDKEYEQFIMEEVYMFTSELEPINRFILIILAEDQNRKKYFSPDEIWDKLGQDGIKIPRNEIHHHMKILVMRFILIDDGKDRYSFALPFFPDMIRKRNDINLKETTRKEIREGAKQSL